MLRIPSTIAVMLLMVACARTEPFHDQEMDFGAVRTVAVMPFANLSRDNLAGERVRDVMATTLMATGAVYVVPVGEVSRGIARVGMANPLTPSLEEAVKLGAIIKADAIITGVVREYGDVRSGSTSANVISLSSELMEAQTGKVVWRASSTKGGIGIKDRLLGGGGEPMNVVTERAVNDLLDQLF